MHIGILVVIENRAVIEGQTHVCFVVGKYIIADSLSMRKVFRQK